jgi:hypothetical protein
MSATLEINLFADYFQVILPALFLEDTCMHAYIYINSCNDTGMLLTCNHVSSVDDIILYYRPQPRCVFLVDNMRYK